MLPHISENNEPVNNLFDLPIEDIAFSLNNNSSDDDDDDDDNRLLIGKLLNKTYFLLICFTFYNKLNRYVFQINSFKNCIFCIPIINQIYFKNKGCDICIYFRIICFFF